MKKTGKRASAIAFLLALALILAFVPAPRAYASDMSGECGKDGDNLTWSYSGGVLTITGAGEMADYEERSDCPWYDVRDDIERVELPEGLESIGDRAFSYCGNLTSVELPDSLTNIGNRAFSSCSGLASIELPERLESIGDRVFSYCFSLTAIELPESITFIGANPFIYCHNLTSIQVSPSHPYLETIDGVLFSKPAQRLVCYPCAFDRESYSVPEGIRSIGDGAFYGCERLTSIELPDSLESIGDHAFVACSRLTAMKLPEGLSSIGSMAFYDCWSLTSIELPEGFTTLYYGAFMKCSGVTTITLPSTLSTMKDLSLNCKNVKSIICHIDEPFAIDKRVFSFDAIFQNARLFVPFGTIDKYKSTAGWNSFKHIIEPGDANADGVINAADIVEVAAYLNDHPNDSLEEISADADGDGVITPNDLKLIIGIIMGR